MAQSVKTDFNQWSQFDHHAYDIVEDDFVHQNLLTVKANILSEKGLVHLQQTLKRKPTQVLTTTGETNIWFPLKNAQSLYFQYRSQGFRVHLDNGLIKRNHLQYNFYGSFEADRHLSNQLFKFGCETLAQKWKLNLRYRYGQNDDSHCLYSRYRYDYQNWTFQGLKATNLRLFAPLLNCFLVGYYQGNQTYHLRVEHQDWKNTKTFDLKNFDIREYFDTITFNYTRTLNANERFGVQTGINSEGNFQGVTAVWQGYDPDTHQTLKLKANSNMTAALSLRNRLSNFGSYVFGVGIEGLGSTNKVSFGVEVDLNL